jgi:hypothetical protein
VCVCMCVCVCVYMCVCVSRGATTQGLRGDERVGRTGWGTYATVFDW